MMFALSAVKKQRFTKGSVLFVTIPRVKDDAWCQFSAQNCTQKDGRHLGKSVAFLGFPGGTVVKNPPANAGDTGSSPGPGISHMPWSN